MMNDSLEKKHLKYFVFDSCPSMNNYVIVMDMFRFWMKTSHWTKRTVSLKDFSCTRLVKCKNYTEAQLHHKAD